MGNSKNVMKIILIFSSLRLPDSFNFTRKFSIWSQIVKYRRKQASTLKFNVTYPMKVESHLSGFRSLIRLKKKHSENDTNHHESQVYGGVRYLFHSPYDLFSKNSIRHQSLPTFRVLFFIEPQQTNIVEALNDYSPERRGCYLPNEKSLKFFKKFSKENCRSECLANTTLEVCGCVQFFMVRETSTRICGIHEIKCYQQVEAELSKSDQCHCLLECEEIVYKFEAKQMELVVFVS
jgi:hypothetical protein